MKEIQKILTDFQRLLEMSRPLIVLITAPKTYKVQLNQPEVTIRVKIFLPSWASILVFDSIVLGLISMILKTKKYFQHNGAPPRYAIVVRDFVDEIFNGKLDWTTGFYRNSTQVTRPHFYQHFPLGYCEATILDKLKEAIPVYSWRII